MLEKSNPTYEFTPGVTSDYMIYTSPYDGIGAENDCGISLYTDAACKSENIASGITYGGSNYRVITKHLEAGTTYYIQLTNEHAIHVQLNVIKKHTAEALNEGTEVNKEFSEKQYCMFSFTPNETAGYAFGTDADNMYIKLYKDAVPSSVNMISHNGKKVIAELMANTTYYIWFSGRDMKAASGSISVTRTNTLEFKKRTDSNFIYVNNPEYITKWDIVDDSESKHTKTFEQKGISGKNTYYETHLSWYSVDEKKPSMPTGSSFYSGVDFYNPNDYNICIDVSRLVYTNNKTLMSNYINNDGEHFCITISPHGHEQLFDYTQNKMINERQDCLGIFIIFDFNVSKENGGTVPQGEGITVSALNAYNYDNIKLKEACENMLKNGNEINSGDMIYSGRPNEGGDLYQKYKGIARDQSNQIDADIDIDVNNNTSGNINLRLKDENNELINGYYPHEQSDWNVQINPLNDSAESILHTTVENLHKFTYHYDNNKYWYFDFMHHDARSDGNGNINGAVTDDVLNTARNVIASGQKADGSLDEYALQMGSWGVVYHYTITVYNSGSKTKKVNMRFKPHAKYTLFGKRNNTSDKYTFADNGESLDYFIPFDGEDIGEKETKTFEIVTMSALGDGGLENTITVE